MRNALRFSLLSLSLAATRLAHAQPDLVLYRSASGDYIGQGATYVTTNAADFSVNGTASTLVVGAFGFQAYFQGPDGAPLSVGVYTNAARWPFNGAAPGLSVSGNGRGCNTVCGSFEILELSTDGAGQIERLWVTFTHVCECFFPPLNGEIRYRSLLAPPVPSARTLRVPQQFATIQLALDDASPLAIDTVLVSPGVYAEAIQFKGKRARVVSAEGPAVTAIRPSPGPSAVTINAGETAEALLSGFTITASAGVGVSGASPTIASNIFLNCGTGVDVYFASPIIRGNLITGGSGDGIHLQGAATPMVEGNIIRSHAAGVSMFAAGAPTIRNNVIMANRSDGLNMVNQSDADIVQNLIIGNAGSGIAWLVPSGARGPLVVNNTIVRNGGPGISADGYDAASAILNNIIVGTPALSVGGFNDVNPPVIGHNNIYATNGMAYTGLIADMTGVAGNISSDPRFACLLGDDYRLLPGSPCVDAGTNGAPQIPATDLEGRSRMRDGNGDAVAVVDLGAYELNPANPPAACLYIFCPQNVEAVASVGQTSAVVTYAGPVVPVQASVACVPTSGSIFPSGTTLVTCTASEGPRSTNCSFSVTVQVPPILTAQAQDTNVAAGQTLQLAVVAEGTAPLTYRWTFEGVNLAGATNAILSLPNAQASHDGIYRAMVQNPYGTATSTVARVRVLPAGPAITAQPASLAVGASSNATFTVAALGSLPMAFRWSFNGDSIPTATGTTHTVSNVQAAHAGSYQVLVSNAAGTTTSAAATLTVLPTAPIFTVQPQGTSVVAGDSFLLSARARGSEPLAYQWRRDGVDLPGAHLASLVRSNVTMADGGPYSVVVSNAAGGTTSGVAQVIVFQRPTIQQSLSHRVVDAGATVVLAVQATASPAPAYSWQFNGATLSETNASLTLSNLRPAQSGYYQVTIANQFGSTSSVCRVSVLGPPSVMVAWGDNAGLQTDVPADLDDLVAVSGGSFHTLALRRDGSLVAWGFDGDGQASAPTNALRLVSIAAGAAHNLAVTENGSVVAWGRNDFGQRSVPGSVTSVLAVAAGESHSSALLSSGAIVNWGDNTFGQVTGSANISGSRAIAAGRHHGLALRANGSVAGWGFNLSGQASPPSTLTNAAAVAAGYLHSLALRSNGTVVAWGDNSYGQINVPVGLSNVTAIACGDFHSLALRANGSLVVWGDNSFGQADVPAGLDSAVAVAAGYYHSLALLPARSRLRIGQTVEGWVVTWEGPGTLQTAPAMTGPFIDLPGFSGSYTNVDLSAPARFFRLRQ
jgi:parallel beta-helix repeat protein